LLLSPFVDDAVGGGPGPTCSPCEYWGWDGFVFRCKGCEADCPGCSWCDSSIPRCKSICLPSECKTCNICVNCKVCGNDPNRFCCNGLCCDPRRCEDCNATTHRCQPCGGVTGAHCCDNGPAGHEHYCCDKGKTCCNGNCCDPCQCQDCNLTTGACKSKCKPENCETCDGSGHCIVCNGDPKKCCHPLDHTCKQCCKNATTGNCEGHNSDCGCDPIGWADCTGSIKEWTIGQTRFCWSECGGTPCYKDVPNVNCYAWQACDEGYFNNDSLCISPPNGCAYTVAGICQDCWSVGDAHIEKQLDCQCD